MLPDTGERAFRASTVLPLGHPRRRARTSAHFIGLGRGEDGSLLRDLAHLCVPFARDLLAIFLLSFPNPNSFNWLNRF